MVGCATRAVNPHPMHGARLTIHCGQEQSGRCMPGCFCLRRAASLSARRRCWSCRLDLAVLLLRRLSVEESESES